MSKEYETRVTSWTVMPKGDPTFSEMATVVSIDDEAAGEFVTVTQSARTDLGKIAIDVAEWPALRATIDKAISECRSNDEVKHGWQEDVIRAVVAKAKGQQ